jgi:hypothetical protein
MWRIAIGGFLILHGVLNAAIWIPQQRGNEMKGFGQQASWLFAEVRPAVVTLALIAASGFVFAGATYMLQLDLWTVPAAIAAIASMALIAATFTPWWSVAILINAVILYAAWQTTAAQFPGR